MERTYDWHMVINAQRELWRPVFVLSTSSEEVGDGTGLYGDSSVRSSDGVCDETLSPSDSVLGAKGNGRARLQPE